MIINKTIFTLSGQQHNKKSFLIILEAVFADWTCVGNNYFNGGYKTECLKRKFLKY